MKNSIMAILLPVFICASLASIAQSIMKKENSVMVGGAPMLPSRTIVDNAMNSKDHTTLVAAVKAAGLVETLKGKGPFTVFAPTNAAFSKLAPGTVDNLLKPENLSTLQAVLNYHVVSGKLDSMELMKWIKKGKGTAELTTVQGGKIWIMSKNKKLWLKDQKGGMAEITISDVYQSNGVIHVIDTVLMPK